MEKWKKVPCQKQGLSFWKDSWIKQSTNSFVSEKGNKNNLFKKRTYYMSNLKQKLQKKCEKYNGK